MKRMLRGVAVLAIGCLVALAGCSSKSDEGDTAHPKAGLQVVDTQMTIAKANASYLAGKFVQESPQFNSYAVEPATDSTISADCPQGDGWATLYLIAPKGTVPAKVALKCSTWSAGKGCVLQEDFNKKSYKQDDGQCQPVGEKVIYPLTKLVTTG